jgi:hypothetical protein
MKATEIMLAGYYIKAGAPQREADLIASMFGGGYLELQTKHRMNGAGNKSKALAAAEICDFIAGGASLYGDFLVWDQYKTPLDLVRVIDLVGAANICRTAVYAYALDQDITGTVMDDANDFLDFAEEKARIGGVAFDRDKIYEVLLAQVKITFISAAAFGSRKGILTRILG